MKNKYFLVIFYLLEVIAMIGCSINTGNKNGVKNREEDTPFNYIAPNIYIYSIKATSVNDAPMYSDTLGLMCTNKICNRKLGQTFSWWLFLSKSSNETYILNPTRVNNVSSGTLSNNDKLLIHPPREGKYIILQICPYPYLEFPLYVGKKWDWDLTVGSQWSPSSSIKWNDNELFSSKYEATDTLLIKTPMGRISCYHIHATNTSKFGISSADFYYSYKYGIIKLFYLPLDKTKIEFNLLSITNDPALFKAIMPNYQANQDYLNFIKDSSDFR